MDNPHGLSGIYDRKRNGRREMAARQAKKRQQVVVGWKIRELRKAHHLTQSELANRIGVQQSDLCRMETGEYKVSLDTLFKILSIFELNIGDFFQEESPAALSSEERELLALYRQLGSSGRMEVLEFLRFKVQNSDRGEAD